MHIIACVRGYPVVPLFGNICTISSGTIGKEIGANGKMIIPLVPMVQILPNNGTNVRTPNTCNVLFPLGFNSRVFSEILFYI